MTFASTIALAALSVIVPLVAAAESCFPDQMCPGIWQYSFSCELPSNFDNCIDYRFHIQLELLKNANARNGMESMATTIADWVAGQS